MYSVDGESMLNNDCNRLAPTFMIEEGVPVTASITPNQPRVWAFKHNTKKINLKQKGKTKNSTCR